MKSEFDFYLLHCDKVVAGALSLLVNLFSFSIMD